ncbi:Dihydropteroate synthase [Streptomyces xanthophaeus]|nr:Dihydropteroate synthase [Streptomyces xanthophaeus]
MTAKPAAGAPPPASRPVEGLPDWDRCAVMGVVNVTPDSFSDGGRWFDTAAAAKRGLSLVADGADLVAEGVLVSVDTMRAAVARRAVEAGVVLVNDVSGGLAEPAMTASVAACGVPFVLMHRRGSSRDMNSRAVYGDVVAEVVAELGARMDAAVTAGIAPERLVIDPGLGFAKEARHDLALVAGPAELRALGRPVLVAGSRKRFLGHVLADADGTPPPADRRDAATAALSAIAAHQGAWAVRVHDVRATADAVRVARAVTPAA